MKAAGKRALFSAALIIGALSPWAASQARGELKKCVGPAGEAFFTNQDCPEGYTLEASRPASEGSPGTSGDEPYICRFSSILSEPEIVSALTEAESSLEEAQRRGDEEKARYWRNCLAGIRQRQQALREPPPGASRGEKEREKACSGGTFEYREGAMYYTNSFQTPCTGLRAACTFQVRQTHTVRTERERGILDRGRREGVSTTSGQSMQSFTYPDRIGKLATVKIGDVTVPGRVTGWNCSEE